MPSSPTIPLPAAPLADWRERLLKILASEGVTEPTYVPPWQLVLFGFLKIVGWYVFALLLILGIPAAMPSMDLNQSDPLSASLILLWFFGVPVVLFWFVWPRAQHAVRELQMGRLGRNPSRALMKARRPPIFYLRSFAFDQASSAPSKWMQRLATMGYGLSAVPTPEMALIRRLSRYTPVLAIGRPGDFHPPPGAMRFYVTDARWQPTVEAILPCCELVVWVSGDTRGLTWEIEHLIKILPPQRLLLWPHVRVYKWKRKKRADEWQHFVDTHQDVFPKPLPRDVRRTRFIAFDADWTPIEIPSARYPTKFSDRLNYLELNNFGLRSFLKERFR